MPPTIFGNFRPDEYRDLEKQLAEQQRLNSELQNRNNALAVLSLQLTQQSDISDAAEDLIISAQQDAGSLSYLSPEEQARLAEVVKVQKIKELADKEKAQLIAEVTGQVNQLDFIESERQKILSDMQKDGSIDEITRKAKLISTQNC